MPAWDGELDNQSIGQQKHTIQSTSPQLTQFAEIQCKLLLPGC